MLDLIAAILLSGMYATLVGTLVASSAISRRARLVTLALAAGWGAVVVGLAALGGFAPGVTGPIPAPVLPFLGALAILFGVYRRLPGFSAALESVPLSVLVGLNAARLGGVFFLLLASAGRLSGPFPPAAGWGDIAVGLAAIPLAAALLRGGAGRRWVRIWNRLGALDLISAISLALLSAPGVPFRLFADGPGTRALTTLPWIMVPTMLVPVYLLLHFSMARRLAKQRVVPATALA